MVVSGHDKTPGSVTVRHHTMRHVLYCNHCNDCNDCIAAPPYYYYYFFKYLNNR
jgi:hypothetical protein